jgi:ferritin-like metal-binding protein YciE
MESLDQLFEDTVRDVYYAEKKILKALPKMAKKANSPKLAKAFEMHVAETEAQVDRLEQVFELMGKAPRGKTCPAIDGIIEEGEEIMKEAKDQQCVTPACWQPLRPSSITRSHAMARSSRGLASSACRMR